MANPIHITHIDHVVIRARDLTKLLWFYREVLGCPLERELTDLGLYQLRAGESLIDLVDINGELGKQGGGPPNTDAQNMEHLCLQIKSWDASAIVKYLHAHGIETGEVAERYGAGGMGPSIYIDDPEGNTVELKGNPHR